MNCVARHAYFAVCGGGCPSNKLAEHGTFVATETTKCRFKIQAMADLLMERLERQINLSPTGQFAAQTAD